MTIETFSRRLLNPFHGIAHIIRCHSAEAVTTDGVNWDIYVSNDALLTDLPENQFVQTRYLRYARWSAEEGLRRGPIFPSYDFTRLKDMGDLVGLKRLINIEKIDDSLFHVFPG